MVATHCQPSALGTDELTPTDVPGTAYIGTPSGTKRAVVFLFHGYNGWGQNPATQTPTDVGLLTYYIGTLASSLVTAGFVVVWPMEIGDCYGSTLSQGAAILDDVANDPNTTKGTRHAAAIGHHIDHLHLWASNTYPGLPQVPIGMSWGGMYVLQAVTQHPTYWGGYAAHHPASVLSKVNPGVGQNFTSYSPSGLDISSTALNAVNIPGYLGWGSADTAVDYPNSGDLLTPAIYTAASGAGMPVTPNCDGTGTASAGSFPEQHWLTDSSVPNYANPNNDVYRIMAWAGTSANAGQLPF